MGIRPRALATQFRSQSLILSTSTRVGGSPCAKVRAQCYGAMSQKGAPADTPGLSLLGGRKDSRAWWTAAGKMGPRGLPAVPRLSPPLTPQVPLRGPSICRDFRPGFRKILSDAREEAESFVNSLVLWVVGNFDFRKKAFRLKKMMIIIIIMSLEAIV